MLGSFRVRVISVARAIRLHKEAQPCYSRRMERKLFSCKSFSEDGTDGRKRGLGFFRKHCEKKKKRDLFVFFALMYFGKTEMSCIELSSEL